MNPRSDEYREYHRKYWKDWRTKNKEAFYDQKRRYRARILQWMREFKIQRGCAHCGETHPSCLEFHHLDSSERERNLADMIGTWGKRRFEEEFGRCLVLCANCHRKTHWQEESNREDIEKRKPGPKRRNTIEKESEN